MLKSPSMIAAKKHIYDPLGFICTHLKKEKESQEYEACTFQINEKRIIFRAAKITPTKTGQFVTFWKRINGGPIMPYDQTDPFDVFVVTVVKNERIGQFVFPKSALLKHGVISLAGVGGKRAIRVYPTWDVPDNQQAKKTQEWQKSYFFEVDQTVPFDGERVRRLYS